MKIAFFLIPKAETTFVYDYNSVRQVMEKMERSGYNAIPVLNKEGHYLYTIGSDDLLRLFKNTPDLRFSECEKIRLGDVLRKDTISAVSANASIEAILEMALSQNFIPVVDDYYTYIGIVRRREIMQYLQKKDVF